MKTLLKNLTIIPMTKDEYYFSGDIGIFNDKIAFVGKDSTFVADQVIDCSACIALPGLVNTHTHLAMTIMRNYKDDSPSVSSWLSQIFKIEDTLIKEDIYTPSMLGLAEMIHSGISTFSDMYYFQTETVRACHDMGVRAVIGQTIFGDIQSTKDRFKNTYPAIVKAIGDNDKLTISVAPHAIYTTTKESYEYSADFARDNNLVLHTHLSEGIKEVEDCLFETKKRPAEYLESIGYFRDTKSTLAHCVHLDDNEIEIVKDSSILHNPASNCKLSSGIANIAKYTKSGVNVALGTDGASSNNRLSLTKDMHLAAMLSGIVSPQVLKPYDFLKMATINGAKALNLDSKIGTLEKGKDADILIINTNNASMTPINNIFSSLVYSLPDDAVDSLFIKGKPVMLNRVIQTADENEIMKKARKDIANILTR